MAAYLPAPAVAEGGVAGAVALGDVPGIVEADPVPVLADPEVPGLGEAAPPDRWSLQATVPAIVKQAMAINAAVRNVRIVCSFFRELTSPGLDRAAFCGNRRAGPPNGPPVGMPQDALRSKRLRSAPHRETTRWKK
jgi:hypothetical protein